MLIFWGLFMGVPVIGSGSSGANASSAALSIVNLQATVAPRAAHRPAKAKSSSPPKPKLIAPGPPAAEQAASEPDLAALLEEAGAAVFEPLSGLRGAENPCSLAQDIATDLQNHPFAQRAVARIPVQSLSVAGALLLWDGRWISANAAGDPDAGSAMLRAIILREIAAAKPECLAELNAGPQFLFINGGVNTVTIVIGSGQWRWEDLVTSQ